MSGRAIIIVVTGIIIISSVIFYNIEAASTRITANFNDYWLRQNAQNIAQSGVNLALRQLTNNRTWRTGFSNLAMLGGSVSVSATDTVYRGISSVMIRSVGTVESGSSLQTQATSIAYTYFPASFKPIDVKGLLTINASNSINGNITLDARDHDLAGNIIAGQGTYAVSTTGPSFTLGSGAAKVGGTVGGIDLAPNNPAPAGTVLLNQPPPAGGFPGTPDSALGGSTYGYSEGTLKAIALSGVGGSQYVTDPSKLKYPLSGVTYVEVPAGSPWIPASPVTGGGLLIVHNATKNASLKNMDGVFKGLVIGDNIEHLHGTVLGAIITLTPAPSGNVLGNGNASIMYSDAAIKGATGFLTGASNPKVIGWWE
jgi:hypothetical protein